MALTKVTGGTISTTSDYQINNLVGVAGTFTGNLNVEGVLTYEDVTNIDAVGLITARKGIHLGAGATVGHLSTVGVSTITSLTVNGVLTAGHRIDMTQGYQLGWKDGSTNRARIHGDSGSNFIVETGSSNTERFRIATDGDLTHTGSDNVEYKMKCGSSSGNNIIAFLNSGGTTRGNITYDSDNNFLFFNVNQAERLRITSAGRVGIGTDNPSTELSIAGSDPVLSIWEGADGASSSRVQIGTGTVQGFINVYKGDGTRTLQLNSSGLSYFNGGNVLANHTASVGSGKIQAFSSQDAIDILSYSTTDTHGGRLTFYRSKNGTIGSNTEVADGDSLGRIDWRGYNDDGTAYNIGATIEAEVDGTPDSVTDMPSALIFKTSAEDSSDPTERVRISAKGGVTANGSFYQEDTNTSGGDALDKTIEFNRRGVFLMLISFSLGTTTTDVSRNVYSLGLFTSRSNGVTWTAIQQDLTSTHVGNLTISDNNVRGQLRVQKASGSDDRACAFRIDVLSSADVGITVTDT